MTDLTKKYKAITDKKISGKAGPVIKTIGRRMIRSEKIIISKGIVLSKKNAWNGDRIFFILKLEFK